MYQSPYHEINQLLIEIKENIIIKNIRENASYKTIAGDFNIDINKNSHWKNEYFFLLIWVRLANQGTNRSYFSKSGFF